MVKSAGWIIVTAFAVASCMTTPEPAEEAALPEPTYEFRSGMSQSFPSPLPNRSSIFVDWKQGETIVASYEGFRAWDINRDGRFEMLEVLSQKGVTTAWAYDFDGDGKVDLVQATAEADQGPMTGLASIPSQEDASNLLQMSH